MNSSMSKKVFLILSIRLQCHDHGNPVCEWKI